MYSMASSSPRNTCQCELAKASLAEAGSSGASWICAIKRLTKDTYKHERQRAPAKHVADIYLCLRVLKRTEATQVIYKLEDSTRMKIETSIVLQTEISCWQHWMSQSPNIWSEPSCVPWDITRPEAALKMVTSLPPKYFEYTLSRAEKESRF